MIYDKNGNEVNAPYNANGQLLIKAYDGDGNVVFNNEATVDITVMSYNVGQWYDGTLTSVPTSVYETYRTLQRGIMAEYQPDIAAFQEYASTFSSGHTTESEIGEYFTDSYVNNKSTYQVKAVYVNGLQMSDAQAIDFVHNSTWGYVKAKVKIGGKDVWIINSHLATSSNEADKVAQAQELLQIVSSMERFILFGDFNTVCTSVNDTEYTTIMKQFVDAEYNVANCAAQFGFNNTWTDGTSLSDTWYPCDHIITSANITMKSVVVDDAKLAVAAETGVRIDHCPIVAYLTV